MRCCLSGGERLDISFLLLLQSPHETIQLLKEAYEMKAQAFLWNAFKSFTTIKIKCTEVIWKSSLLTDDQEFTKVNFQVSGSTHRILNDSASPYVFTIIVSSWLVKLCLMTECNS